MNLTANYKLQKPLSNEKYNVAVQNANMDLIDSALNQNKLSIISEIDRAKTAEKANSDAVVTEMNRAIGVENTKAPLESPTLTGVPNAPTASADTNTSQIATTAFAHTIISDHDSSATSHSDIRDLIIGLTTRLNTLADSDDTTLDQLSEIVTYIKNNKNLIDNITTDKVNVSDIIDNLTSTEANKPLSANQGNVLNNSITSLATIVDEKADKSFSNIKVDNTTIAAESKADTIELVPGSNVTIISDNTTNKITISSDNTTYGIVTEFANGLMTSTDKSKLDGIESGANAYELPVAGTSLGGIKTDYVANGKNYPVKVETNGSAYVNVPWTDTNTNTTYDVVSKTGNGLCPALPNETSTTKYLRQDGTWQVPPDNNTVYTHPTTAGNKHIPSGGSSGQILKWSANGTAVWANVDSGGGIIYGSSEPTTGLSKNMVWIQ